MSEQDGDWYCKNCGYLPWNQVTFNETCDECHIPVAWHTADEQSEIDRLKAEVAELRKSPWHYPSRGDGMPEEGQEIVYYERSRFQEGFQVGPKSMIYRKRQFTRNGIYIYRYMPIPEEQPVEGES